MKTMTNRALVATVFLLIGLPFITYPNIVPEHARIYVEVGENNLSILDYEIEQLLPLAGIDPYVRNMTSGNRTLRVEAVAMNITALQQQVEDVGVGFTLLRTANFGIVLPMNTAVEISIALIDSKAAVIATASSLSSVPVPVSYYIAFFAFLAVGLSIVSLLRERSAKTRRTAKKRMAVGPRTRH